MNNVNIVVEFVNKPQVPDGYKLFRATRWAIPELGLSYETFGFSSFEVIPLWIPETRQFSAISNFSILDLDGIRKLQALQPHDGYSVNIKMNWLVASGNGGLAMWTGDSTEWNTAVSYRVGTMLWGDQLFAATKETFNLTTSIGAGVYRKVLAFKKSDWLKDPKENPHLFPRATVTGRNNGISNSFGRGEIRTMLQVLDPNDYKFAGGLIPTYYIPDRWCLPV